AAIAWVRERFPRDELVGLSHSIGALALAAAPNAGAQDRMVFICPHTAYYGDYRPLYRLPMALLWHGLMPLVTALLGYFPAKRLRPFGPASWSSWKGRQPDRLMRGARVLRDARGLADRAARHAAAVGFPAWRRERVAERLAQALRRTQVAQQLEPFSKRDF